MELEEMFGGPFKPLKYKPVEEGDNWDSDMFYKAYEQFKGLEGLDVRTAEGLEKYAEYDPNALSYTDELREATHEDLVKLGKTGLRANSAKNTGQLVKLLDNDVTISLGFSHPRFKKSGKGESEKAYNSVVDALETYSETAQMAKNDRGKIEAHLLSSFKEGSAEYRHFAKYIEGWVQGKVLAVQKNAVEILKTYGANKFVLENLEVAETLIDQSEDEKKVQQELGRLNAAAEAANPDEKIEAMKKAEAEGKKYFEAYGQNLIARQTLPKMIDAIQDKTYDALKSKKAEEEAAKEAKKAAKKK